MIEAEPSELVRIPMYMASNKDSLREIEMTACGIWPGIRLTECATTDFRCEGEDFKGERMGPCYTEVDILRYALQGG